MKRKRRRRPNDLPPESAKRRYFRRRLQELIDEQGLNQSEVARRMGGTTNQATVSDWLNPDRRAMPKSQYLDRLAEVLGVSTDALLGVERRTDSRPVVERAYRSGALDVLSDVEAKIAELRKQWSGTTPTPPGGEGVVASPAERAEHQRQSERGLRAHPHLRKHPRREESA